MFGKKVQDTRVVPVTFKIVFIFTLFILLSNFSTNYVNLLFNQGEQIRLMTQLLIKDLTEMHTYCNNQYEIYQFDKNEEASLESIKKKGQAMLKNSKAVVLGVQPDGAIYFQASSEEVPRKAGFRDQETLQKLNANLAKNKDQGYFNFSYNGEDYFGVYKHNSRWDVFIIRGEEVQEFNHPTRMNFIKVGVIIVLITIVMMVIGIYVINYILRYIGIMTNSIQRMIKSQQLELIDMSGATNDDISYMGIAFNSLSATVDNLVSIFKKFANQDIVNKAYQEKEVRLEGSRRELAILFTDIKSFTFITETLGTDIIKLLNLHYDRAIREIVRYDGVIGSIIGDALLAVYGAIDDATENKSLQSIESAYKLHDVVDSLRERMTKIKKELEDQRGSRLTKKEMNVYKACLLEIGVGIDGGEVFYGTLGSYVRMTNTVIGDRVNSASRLEGLTRVYKVPVICSEYIKNDIEENVEDHGIIFYEIDTVLVKGKTQGAKVYWPVLKKDHTTSIKRYMTYFESGLELYYMGDWTLARKHFAKVKLPLAEVFKERTKSKPPKKWNGIWEMTTK
jgi:class 3 adenylate cyclase